MATVAELQKMRADLLAARAGGVRRFKDQNGEDVLIMNTSAEGTEPFQRDEKSRTFGFKERSDGSVDVQELLAMPSKTPDVHNAYTQLIPNLQDQDGYIYFRGRETAHRTYKMRLHWVDQ